LLDAVSERRLLVAVCTVAALLLAVDVFQDREP
jgi:hypothetical protein